MKLGTRYVIYMVLLHAIMITLAVLLIIPHPVMFFLIEGVIILSLILGIRLYQDFFRPLELIRSGTETIRDQDFSMKFVPVGQGEMDPLIDVYNRMIDQLRKERLRQQEQHYLLEKLIEASPSGIIILDPDEQVSMMNPAAFRLLELRDRDYAHKPLLNLDSPLAIQLGNLETGKSEVVSISGIQSYLAYRGGFVDHGFQRCFIVFTELTQQILTTERKSYETVIRMMSHEVNNSIGAINSVLDSLLNGGELFDPARESEVREVLQVAIERNRRLNRFTANFADVVRIGAPMPERCNLHSLLRNVHTLMKVELDQKRIRWNWNLTEDSLVVQADVNQMEQVLVNIVRNALEATGEGGQITVVTESSPATLEIKNDGEPIPPVVQKQLFSPFFTTKSDGQGIGLTLSREILVQHGFRFSLSSDNPEKQTVFRILF